MIMADKWTEALLRERLAKFHTTEYSWEKMKAIPRMAGSRKAAVLIPLVLRNGVVHVWLTKRASHLSAAPGDVAFPGGMKDCHESQELHTSTREAEEEIGLPPKRVSFLTQLLPRVTRNKVLFTPVVGLVDQQFAPVLNTEEVDGVFCPPLQRFHRAERHRSQMFTNRGIEFYIHWFTDSVEGREFVTWGLTADICVELAVAAFRKEPEFEWTKPGDNTVDDPYIVQRHYLKKFAEDIKK